MKSSTFFLITLIPLLCLAEQNQFVSKRKSFTMDLIHRDTLLLSRYNHSSSKLLTEAAVRSVAQAIYFNSSIGFEEKYLEPEMISWGTDYLMRLFLNRGKYFFLALISTGSELLWLNCRPLVSSYEQEVPPYKPVKGNSPYEELLSTNEFCDALGKKRVRNKKKCIYRYPYEKMGYTSGVLSMDNFYSGSMNEDFVKLVFGCSHKTTIKFEKVVQAMIGLGKGKLSLISQLISSKIIEPMFSYCLVPRTAIADSKITFGERGQKTDKTVSVSLNFNENLPFYYVSLSYIIIGETDILIPLHYRDIIIDTGTAMTLLHSTIYEDLRLTTKRFIGIEPTPNPTEPFDLCFKRTKLIDKSLPIITFRLDGRDVHLKSENMFIDLGVYKCLGILPYDGIYIIGNMAQVDFQVEYDLEYNKVSFTPTDCTKVF